MGALSALWLRPSTGLRFRLFCTAFAAGSWIHLTLPDATDDPRWWPANIACAIGAGITLWRGALLGWLLSLVGLAVPLLFFEDQLTQSVFLLACTLTAVGCWVGREAREQRMNTTLPTTVAWLTVLTYALAAFHKFNGSFFDPEISCATGGLQLLAGNWGLSYPQALDPVAAPLFLIAEVGLAGLMVSRPRLALPLAFAIHIPLTIVFAPSFAFVMMSGWVCLFDETQLRCMGLAIRSRLPWILGLGLVLGAASFAFYLRDHWVLYPWWSFREVLLWVGLVASLVSVRHVPRATPRSRPPRAGLLWVAVVVYGLNGLTPYGGVQFHHAGAMLSNLRIDPNCWNHWLMPESIRWVDPYVYVDDATALAPGAAALEDRLESSLWNRRSLGRAARRWCDQGAQNLRVHARFGTRRRTIANLCETPFPFGRPWLPGMRLHQENVARVCNQGCIH